MRRDVMTSASLRARERARMISRARLSNPRPLRAQENTVNNDNGMIGRRLTRREALALLAACGAAGIGGPRRAAAAAGLDAGARPSCIARPEQTEGPFFVEEALERSDIRSDPGPGLAQPGV